MLPDPTANIVRILQIDNAQELLGQSLIGPLTKTIHRPGIFPRIAVFRIADWHLFRRTLSGWNHLKTAQRTRIVRLAKVNCLVSCCAKARTQGGHIFGNGTIGHNAWIIPLQTI